jgi:hypothetical protein
MRGLLDRLRYGGARGLLLLAVGACSVDQRRLLGVPEEAAGASGGSAPVEQPTAGAEPASPTPSGLAPLVEGCADLDTDGVADCQTTLVENPSFGGDVQGWSVVSGATLTWDENNALGDTPSGCARLRSDGAADYDGSPLARAAQCVAVQGQQLVIAYANAFLELRAAAAPSKLEQALLEISFFDSEDCSGARTSYFDTPPSDSLGQWTTIQAGSLSDSATASMSIALAGAAPDAGAVDICFDNVMLKVHAL